MVLKYPYFRDVSEPDIYETATVHTVVGPMESQESDNAHNPIAVSTCELVVAIGNLSVYITDCIKVRIPYKAWWPTEGKYTTTC